MINKKFLFGGNATFTVSNPSNEHYTFKVTKTRFFRDSSFVKVLTGQNNNNDYTYVGVIDHDKVEVFMTKKSGFKYKSKPVQVLVWALNHIRTGKPCPEGYNIQHAGKCGQCGRKLTTPHSIEVGFGPVCDGLS